MNKKGDMKVPKTRRKKGNRAGNSKSNSTKKKQKALEKINKATVKLKRKQEPCPICLEKIAKKDRVNTICGHFFHKKCMQGWCIQKVKDKKNCFCPVCKTDLKLQTREAKNKIAEQKRLEKKNKPLGKPLQGEELARVQERFQRIREQDRIEREERQRRIEELNRETQRQLDELGISPGESSDEED